MKLFGNCRVCNDVLISENCTPGCTNLVLGCLVNQSVLIPGVNKSEILNEMTFSIKRCDKYASNMIAILLLDWYG